MKALRRFSRERFGGRQIWLALACAAAVAGFAANSLLARAALGAGRIDASSYTLIRLASGAVALSGWMMLRRRRAEARGSWAGGAALMAYAAAFSYSYLRIGAALGALVLFPTVKLALLVWGARRGERPAAAEWLGAGVALFGLAALMLPGVGRADPAGIGLMIIAGLAWAVYTVGGAKRGEPVAATAGNFVRSAILALPLAAADLAAGHASRQGVLLAVLSGAIASGPVYCLWYGVVPELTAMQMGLAQLAVPALATLGAVALLGEVLTTRILLAAAAIFAGIGLALGKKGRAVPRG